jgi:hypothetical protein
MGKPSVEIRYAWPERERTEQSLTLTPIKMT